MPGRRRRKKVEHVHCHVGKFSFSFREHWTFLWVPRHLNCPDGENGKTSFYIIRRVCKAETLKWRTLPTLSRMLSRICSSSRYSRRFVVSADLTLWPSLKIKSLITRMKSVLTFNSLQGLQIGSTMTEKKNSSYHIPKFHQNWRDDEGARRKGPQSYLYPLKLFWGNCRQEPLFRCQGQAELLLCLFKWRSPW